MIGPKYYVSYLNFIVKNITLNYEDNNLQFIKSGWTINFVLLATFFSVTLLHAVDDMSWVIPGKTVYDDELYVKINSGISPIEVKVYDGIAQTGIPALDIINLNYGIYEFRKSFIIIDRVRANPRAADLDRWYTIRFPNDFDLFDILEAFSNCSQVELAELSTIYHKIYSPNDDLVQNQWYLSKCELSSAWDVSQGSEEIIVGIVDDGMDMNAEGENSLVIHEDIADNIWINFGEDIDEDGIITLDDWDGEDNDNNGYADDFHGWDYGGRDNWPDDFHGDGHGTHVGGLASAVADNEVGVAGAGFSCKLMIAAAYDRGNPDNVRYGYEGIVYCASNGADIINLSWGSDSGPFGRSQEVIEFALGEGVAIFAGAGNDNVFDNVNRNRHFYPCAYDGVFGVGASDQSDNKADFSNFGDYIDIVAPGVSMISTYPRNEYANLQGTSMSSPFAAGIGALMLSVRPNLTANELLEKMQLTSVDILEEDGPAGIQYRVNAGDLLNSTHPEFELISWDIHEWNGNQNGRAEPGESISLMFNIGNREGYEDAHGLTLHLENDDEAVSIIRTDRAIGNLAGGEIIELDRNRGMSFRVRRSEPHYTTFRLTVNSDEGWESVFELNLTLGHPYYLLMDDDSEGIQEYFEADLDSISIVHDTWNIEEDWFPSQEWLNAFSFVVWETGNSRDPLSDDEQALIGNYLEAGGSLLIIGQYIGDDHGDTEFFTNYLHSEHIADNVDVPQVAGVDGHPVSEGMEFLLIGGAAAGNNDSPSALSPLEGAETIFTYPQAEGSAGIYFSNGTYQVIYLGFALEAAAGLGGTTSRSEFIQTALQRFYEVGVSDDNSKITLPMDYFLSQAYPNPFNSTTSMQLSLPIRDNIKLQAIDLRGRTVSVLYDGWLNSGTHNFSWSVKDQAAGVYFMRFNWDGGSQSRRLVLLK